MRGLLVRTAAEVDHFQDSFTDKVVLSHTDSIEGEATCLAEHLELHLEIFLSDKEGCWRLVKGWFLICLLLDIGGQLLLPERSNRVRTHFPHELC